jgi:ABC-type Na+ transport system ATPase subunit NatA
VLATLLTADAGQARICGYDVVTDAVQVRQLIALTGQFASVDDELTGTENLLMIGRLLGFSRARARARAAELLESFDLTGAAGRAAKTYSGGMRCRLDLAASLVGQPQVPVPGRADHRTRPAAARAARLRPAPPAGPGSRSAPSTSCCHCPRCGERVGRV